MPDGGLDQVFDITKPGSFTPSLVRVCPDGRLIVAKDNLTGPDGQPTRLLRLFADGQVDPSFKASLDVTPECIGFAPDGILYAAGKVLSTTGSLENRVYRLRAYDSSASASVQWSTAQLSSPASAGSAAATVLRDGDATQPSSVQITAAGEAAPNAFVPFETTLEFAPGQRARTVSIPFAPVKLAGAEELITVELHAPSGANLGTNSVLKLHVVQDQGAIEVITPGITAAEPAGTLLVDLCRKGALAYSVRWTWSLQSQTDNPAAWFSATNGTVLLTPGQTNTTLGLHLSDNTAVEEEKDFQLVLDSASRHFPLGARDRCSIKVLENDQPGFPGDGIDATVNALLVQADGRTLLSGSFHSVNGTKRNRLARLQSDATLADSFRPALVFPSEYDSLQTMTVAPDGKIYIGGAFTNVSSISRSTLARLNPDGSLDPAFAPVPLPGRVPTGLAATPDNQLLVVGDGADYNGTRDGLSLGAIAMYRSDGSKDTNFSTTAFGGTGSKLVASQDGRFYALGTVLVYSNALPAGRTSPKPGIVNPVLRRGLARFETNGTLDLSFSTVLSGDGGTRMYRTVAVADLLLQNDGRILLAGGFTNVNSKAALGLARLLPDGSLDESFHAEVERVQNLFSVVRSIGLGTDGSVTAVIEDLFFTARLARFHADGTLDEAFGIHQTSASSTSVAVLPSEDVLWAGGFLSVDGRPRFSLARFHSDGTLAPDGALGLTSVVRIGSSVFQMRVESRIQGSLRLEKSLDLKTWTPITDQEISPGLTQQTISSDSPAAAFYRAVGGGR
jgi:uncharacterized delta-60 repeat protein